MRSQRDGNPCGAFASALHDGFQILPRRSPGAGESVRARPLTPKSGPVTFPATFGNSLENYRLRVEVLGGLHRAVRDDGQVQRVPPDACDAGRDVTGGPD